jgi:tryptophan synthase alpha chain
MNAIDLLFQRLRTQNRKAFIAFLTAGDPNLDATVEVARRLAKEGVSLIEIGFPYSDPIADGPVIQASYTRALANKIKLGDILNTLGDVAPQIAAPLVTMVSYAIVYRYGLEKYVDEVSQRGLAGLIVPDLPVEESAALAKICAARDVSLIQLVTPTTPRERAVRIAETSTGFLYYVSVAGITGERTQLPQSLVDNVGWLREQTPLPICIGFGISKPEHVKQLAGVADGLIVGSAIVRRIAEAATKPREAVLKDVGDYVATLIAALG